MLQRWLRHVGATQEFEVRQKGRPQEMLQAVRRRSPREARCTEAAAKRQRTDTAGAARRRSGRAWPAIRCSSKVSKAKFCQGRARDDCRLVHVDGACSCVDPDALVLPTLGNVVGLARDGPQPCLAEGCGGVHEPVAFVDGFCGNVELSRRCPACLADGPSFIAQLPLTKSPDASDNPGPAPELANPTVPFDGATEPFAACQRGTRRRRLAPPLASRCTWAVTARASAAPRSTTP